MIMDKSCTIQDVFERFYPSYEKRSNPPAHHRKTAYHIRNCKTGVFGVNISVCEDCGCISVHNNSCRSRCCPMCQEFPKEKWIDAQKENVLDAPYYHVVFTVPEELNSIIYSNQKLLYDALYHAASATLNELSKDAKYLGADIGYICILHTWGSAMNYHPHIHTIVLGGGLDDENKWKDTGGNFFLPYGVISKVFRGKYLDELKSLWNDSKLKFHGTAEKYQNSYRFKELLDKCYEKNWVTYCKETFNGAQSVINYLGKYTHRIAISIPYDSNVILGVEVAKLFGKPVVKMRKDRGKLEIDHLWDGEFSNGNRVLIVHDVLVSGEQIIHTKNHIPSRCEIVALCCLATRKDVNGLEVLQRENVRVERVIDLSDAEIESLMNQ